MPVTSSRLIIRNPALTKAGRAAGLLPVAPEKASLATKLGRVARELKKWAAAGAEFAPRSVRRERLAICAGCSYWASSGNWGLGECTFPGCGCTKAKAALATSRCPQTPPKWSAWKRP